MQEHIHRGVLMGIFLAIVRNVIIRSIVLFYIWFQNFVIILLSISFGDGISEAKEVIESGLFALIGLYFDNFIYC